MNFTNTFLASTNQISYESTNPEKAKETMKRAMKATIKLQQARYILDLFQQLKRKQIGTTTVEELSKRMCRRLPQKRRRTLVDIIIKWKIEDARKNLNSIRYANTKTWRECKTILIELNILNKYTRIWAAEKVIHTNEFRELRKKKVDFLTKKYATSDITPDDIEGITVCDQQCAEEFDTSPRIYGLTEITNDEKAILTLPPKFSTFQEVDSIECGAQTEKSLAKLRWEINRKEREQRGEIIEEAAFYNPANTTFDFRQMRGTHQRFNKRIKLPSPVDEETEINMHSLKTRLRRVTSEYIQTCPSDKTLSEEEKRGLRSLKERVKRNEVVVYQTDKSGRFSIDSPENYKESGIPHIREDPVITMKEHRDMEHTINAHGNAWVRMINAGSSQNDTDRIRKNMLISDSHPPPLYTTRKDHKECNDENVGPPTRPVCGVTVAANSRLSYMLNIILTEVWKRNNDTVCMSTEDMKAEIDRVNATLSNKKIIIGSADVKALYPSLDIPFTIEKVCQEVLESELKFEGMWYEEIGLYIAVNYVNKMHELEELGLDEVCPTRDTNQGKKPTVQSLTHDSWEDRHSHWNDPARQPTEEEKRKMIIVALGCQMKAVMTNHDYTFNNEIRKQSKGGPIGLDLTGSIAQIFMIWWNKELRRRLELLEIYLLMHKSYVDDINVALTPIEAGYQLIEGEIKAMHEDNLEEAETTKDDERTMKILQEVGNGIHPSIQVTIDYPTNYEEQKMPTLDLKIWVEDTESGCRIMHEHYSKPMATPALLNQRSALPWNTKRTVLTQEALRILLNCSRELPWELKAKHLSKYSARMQFSGYEKKFRAEIIRSALNAYEKLRRAETDGERPLYRPKTWKTLEREKERKEKKNNWYKKGGYDSVMFVPATPGSVLMKKYRNEVEKSGLKIRIVEKAGMSLKQQLQRSDPFKPLRCGREDCFVCTSGGKGSCKAMEVNYLISCEDCEEMESERNYKGETSRTSYVRGGEHLDDFEKKRDKSVLWKHCRDKHNGQVEGRKFRMDVLGVYKEDAMLRQIAEAVRIQESPTGTIMNDKTEWNYVRLPNLVQEE